MEFRKAIDGDEFLRQESIPFVFMSSEPAGKDVFEAYLYLGQGFF